MVQFSNSAKSCHQSEKDGTILKQCQNLITVRKRWCNSQTTKLSPVRKRWYKTQTVPKPVTSQKKMVQCSNKAKTYHQSEKGGTILKLSQNLSPVRKRCYNTETEQNLSSIRKRWYNTETLQKPVTSQKKMVQYSNRVKTRHQSEKDGTILK